LWCHHFVPSCSQKSGSFCLPFSCHFCLFFAHWPPGPLLATVEPGL
jgi:hypothetical protein